MRRKPLVTAIGAVCAATLLSTAGARAQEAGIEEVVTGSRIARDALPQPLVL